MIRNSEFGYLLSYRPKEGRNAVVFQYQILRGFAAVRRSPFLLEKDFITVVLFKTYQAKIFCPALLDEFDAEF